MIHEGLADQHHVGYVYAERRRELVLAGAVNADEWNVLPVRMHRDIDQCNQLVIVDPLSFPVDDLRPGDWSQPITVVWPQSVPTDVAIDLLDGPLLSNLTFFDTLLVDDDEQWEELRAIYRFSESQRRHRSGRSLRRSIEKALRSGSVAARAANELVSRVTNPIDPWTIRSAEEKGIHMVELDALSTAVRASESNQPAGRHVRLTHIGMGVGRFTSLLSRHEYTGFSRGRATTSQAILNFPSLPIQQLGAEQKLPAALEETDLAVVTHEMSALTAAARRSLIESVWRSLRVGGKLIVLDTFAPHRGQRAASADELITDLLHATNHQLVTSSVESIQSPLSPMRNIGVLTLTKIGVPRKW